MTLVLIEDNLSEDERLAQQANPTVKCGWCGEIIRLDGSELAMCQSCYDGMLAEFLRSQQAKQAPSRASDR
jgi:ribosome-binding protein aMBF1 (putative translation factor)